MNILTAVPIYRNRFQKPVLFFSAQFFPIGSFIFVPYSKSARLAGGQKKPSLVIQIENLEKKKFFLRKNKIKVAKLPKTSKIFSLEKQIIPALQVVSRETNLPIEEIGQKLFPKKIIRAINRLSPDKINNLKDIQKFAAKLTPAFINKKIGRGKAPTKSEKPEKYRGVRTISSILSAPKIKKTSLHSEQHYLVDEIRNYFGENAKKGVGSFSFYLGFFKKIPQATIYQYWSETKQSRQSIKNQQKLFWWKIGQFTKTKSEKRNLPAGRQEVITKNKKHFPVQEKEDTIEK